MVIRRPQVWYSPTTEGGAATDPAPAPKPPAGAARTEPAADAGDETPKFTQAQLDAIVRDRLERQKRSVDAAAKAQQEAADAERLKQQGEFEKLAEERGRRVAELEGQLHQREVQALRDAAAAKHRLPAALAARLMGDTAEALDADAASLATLVRPEDARRERAQAAAPGNPPGPRPSGADGERVAQAAREENARRRSYPRL
jgi:hypothetical protein